MSHEIETNANSGYGSSDETASLLVITTTAPPTILPSISNTTNISNANLATAIPKLGKMSASINGPTTTNSDSGPGGSGGAGSSGKPVLMRQDRTSTYLTTSPQLSQNMGTSEESNGPLEDDSNESNQIRTVPDIELQFDGPIIAVSKSCPNSEGRSAPSGASAQHHLGGAPIVIQRCRACRSCDRRASITPTASSLQMPRSVSKESVRSIVHLSPCSAPKQQVMIQQQQSTNLAKIPPVLITTSPNATTTGSGRIIRQSSQPEASSNAICCGGHTCNHPHTNPSASLRQLREAQSEGIAGIAADSLRINGAMRPFKQVRGRTDFL